jgi:hypothetical protein
MHRRDRQFAKRTEEIEIWIVKIALNRRYTFTVPALLILIANLAGCHKQVARF